MAKSGCLVSATDFSAPTSRTKAVTRISHSKCKGTIPQARLCLFVALIVFWTCSSLVKILWNSLSDTDVFYAWNGTSGRVMTSLWSCKCWARLSSCLSGFIVSLLAHFNLHNSFVIIETFTGVEESDFWFWQKYGTQNSCVVRAACLSLCCFSVHVWQKTLQLDFMLNIYMNS